MSLDEMEFLCAGTIFLLSALYVIRDSIKSGVFDEKN